MSANLWIGLGGLLGSGFLGYALFLLGGCLGGHLLAGVLHARYRRRYPGVALLIELIYCLLHPLLYLLVLEPAFFRHATDVRIQAVSWTLLFAYWAFRLGGAALPLSDVSLRRIGAWLFGLCGAWVVVIGIRDGIVGSSLPTEGRVPQAVQVLLCSPLYLVPLWITVSQWLATRTPQSWSAAKVLLSGTRRSRIWASCGVVGMVALTSLASVHAPRATVQDEVLRDRTSILASAQRHRIDPRLLAALYLVSQRDTTTPFRNQLEATAAGAWLTDPKSHFGLAAGLNPSLGATQIKPVTLITARVIRRKSEHPADHYGKEEREVPDAGDAWTRVPSPALERVPFEPWIQAQAKPALVKALLVPSQNLEACAFLLDLYATQWESANPAWAIRDRPEILATLFQIGFQHSRPKADPQPNAFGIVVAEAMHEPWLQAQFGP